MIRKTSILLCFLIVLASTAFCFADPVQTENGGLIDPVTPTEFGYGLNSENTSVEYLTGAQSLSAEEIESKLQEKGQSIIDLAKTIGKVVCIIAFIGCCIGCAVSAFQKGPALAKFIIGAIIAGVSYACISRGELIVLAISEFAKL